MDAPTHRIDLFASLEDGVTKTGTRRLWFWVGAASEDQANRAAQKFCDDFLGTSGVDFSLVPEVHADSAMNETTHRVELRDSGTPDGDPVYLFWIGAASSALAQGAAQTLADAFLGNSGVAGDNILVGQIAEDTDMNEATHRVDLYATESNGTTPTGEPLLAFWIGAAAGKAPGAARTLGERFMSTSGVSYNLVGVPVGI